jgi:hypothetical protein
MYSLRKNYENICLCVSYDFSKVDGFTKSRCDILSGTTQECFPLVSPNN